MPRHAIIKVKGAIVVSSNLLEIDKMHYLELKSSSSDEKINELKQSFIARYTYESVTIDGKNTMTYEDVKHLLDKKIITSLYSEREQKEVLNHAKAYEFVERLVYQRKKLDEEILKDIHEILVDGIFTGGRYRQVNVQIIGSMHQPPDYVKVYDRMNKYFFDLTIYKGSLVQKSALAHAGLFKIYPFLEGNGRLARLVMNYILMDAGFVAISIPLAEKTQYLDHINSFKVEKILAPFSDYIEKLLLAEYERQIEALET